jgi:hypothetical protein
MPYWRPEIKKLILSRAFFTLMVVAGVALASQSPHDEWVYRGSKSSERDECLFRCFMGAHH